MLARVFFALFFRVYKRKECENDTGIMHDEGYGRRGNCRASEHKHREEGMRPAAYEKELFGYSN